MWVPGTSWGIGGYVIWLNVKKFYMVKVVKCKNLALKDLDCMACVMSLNYRTEILLSHSTI